MPSLPARRLADIAPFHVMELMTRAKELEAGGRDIIHMEVGEPDFPTPQPIVAAAQAYIAGGRVRYTAALGLPELRTAIAAFYATRYGLNVPTSRIVVTAGASGGLLLAMACLTEPGSEWLLTDPGYPCNRHFVRCFEGRPIGIPVPCRELCSARMRDNDVADCSFVAVRQLNLVGNPGQQAQLPQVALLCVQDADDVDAGLEAQRDP